MFGVIECKPERKGKTMANFIAKIQGQRGTASRLGSKKSGLSVTANGWHLGISVNAFHNANTERDVFNVYINGGSNGGNPEYVINEIKRNGSELIGFSITEK